MFILFLAILQNKYNFNRLGGHNTNMEEQLDLNPNSVNELSESSLPPLEDDDTPVLSSYALAALQEFLSAEQSHSDAGESEVSLVSEDWRLSQFWYDAETAKTVAEEVIALSNGGDSRVVCIACPTLYAYLKVFIISIFCFVIVF